jgi:hypothetical protein
MDSPVEFSLANASGFQVTKKPTSRAVLVGTVAVVGFIFRIPHAGQYVNSLLIFSIIAIPCGASSVWKKFSQGRR